MCALAPLPSAQTMENRTLQTENVDTECGPEHIGRQGPNGPGGAKSQPHWLAHLSLNSRADLLPLATLPLDNN